MFQEYNSSSFRQGNSHAIPIFAGRVILGYAGSPPGRCLRTCSGIKLISSCYSPMGTASKQLKISLKPE